MDDSNKLTDAALMSLFANGDPAALEFLYDRHRRALYSFALRIMGDPRDAEEVMQDTFLQLWQKSWQFDPARGSLLAWLLTITRHRAISRIRGRRDGRRESQFEDAAIVPQNPGSSHLDRHIANELVGAAFAGLPEVQRNAITMAYFDGFTCEEIASRTETPLGTIKTRMRSGLRTMKKNLSSPRVPGSLGWQLRPAALSDVLITEQLTSRSCRQRDSQDEMKALDLLAEVLAASPARLMDCFLQMPLDLCHAGTGGLSLLETSSEGKQVFRWTHLSGILAKYVGGNTPRNFSPCGVTLDRNSAQLFEYPARHFRYFENVDVPIVEGLVVPFHVGGKTEGTIWIVSHDERVRFDSEDARIMASIGEFAGCALHLNRCLEAEELQGSLPMSVGRPSVREASRLSTARPEEQKSEPG